MGVPRAMSHVVQLQQHWSISIARNCCSSICYSLGAHHHSCTAHQLSCSDSHFCQRRLAAISQSLWYTAGATEVFILSMIALPHWSHRFFFWCLVFAVLFSVSRFSLSNGLARNLPDIPIADAGMPGGRPGVRGSGSLSLDDGNSQERIVFWLLWITFGVCFPVGPVPVRGCPTGFRFSPLSLFEIVFVTLPAVQQPPFSLFLCCALVVERLPICLQKCVPILSTLSLQSSAFF